MKLKNEQLEKKLEKEKKIKQEINKVKKLYKDFPKDKVKVLDGLINDVAFMKISLEEIRSDLVENGLTELFTQGTQEFNRERPEVKIYTTLIQRYSNVMKQLIDLLPEEEKKEQKDELLEFLQNGKL